LAADEQLIKFWWRSGSPPGYRDRFPDSILLLDSEASVRCNYDVITSPAHDITTVSALHAASSVTGARYCETGQTGLGGGMHCPSAFSL